jgi:hypothetical protein
MAQRMPRAEYLSTMQWARYRFGLRRSDCRRGRSWDVTLPAMLTAWVVLFRATPLSVVLWLVFSVPFLATLGVVTIVLLALYAPQFWHKTRMRPPHRYGRRFHEDDDGPGGSGVREPRRPIGPNPALSAKVEPRR